MPSTSRRSSGASSTSGSTSPRNSSTRLICWATTDNGEYLYWLMGQGDDPDTRPIRVNDESGEHWERYDMTVTRFLVGALGGEVRSQILWDEFPQPVHEFRTATAMAD
ncbi:MULTISPECIES: hypothetical protein [unclassified Streptomyces]|uniref:hypothetical protein n=1 Tax=unclassified Streptomyces TaxID=2593676 RepID=UPI00225A2366|nr:MULTISPECIES: hypothetical protein [unclassified Streptomyces]MCX5441467.1 hypothetical protein [Streptomyces sp. NBC_00063]WUB99766.1 hypothetical protein OHO83_07780 [Streptomyces sp. NBC_00569]